MSGAAEEWLQSKSCHIEMSSPQLLEELERVFGNRSRLVDLQETFLNRNWRWRENEKFFDYYQEKVQLGSNFNLPEDVLVQRIIDGIDNIEWECQINAFKIDKTSVLLEKMENAIRDYMTKSTKVVPCRYCKKNNHPSAKCHFREVKPEPCKYCKKIGHAPERCFFNRDVEPCKHCKKAGHLSENCYFKSSGLPESPKASDKKSSAAVKNGTKKKTKSESSANTVKEISDHLSSTKLSEKKSTRWRSKSEHEKEVLGKSEKNSKKKDHLLFTYDDFNFKK